LRRAAERIKKAAVRAYERRANSVIRKPKAEGSAYHWQPVAASGTPQTAQRTEQRTVCTSHATHTPQSRAQSTETSCFLFPVFPRLLPPCFCFALQALAIAGTWHCCWHWHAPATGTDPPAAAVTDADADARPLTPNPAVTTPDLSQIKGGESKQAVGSWLGLGLLVAASC
jgi:hypothetical protein